MIADNEYITHIQFLIMRDVNYLYLLSSFFVFFTLLRVVCASSIITKFSFRFREIHMMKGKKETSTQTIKQASEQESNEFNGNTKPSKWYIVYSYTYVAISLKPTKTIERTNERTDRIRSFYSLVRSFIYSVALICSFFYSFVQPTEKERENENEMVSLKCKCDNSLYLSHLPNKSNEKYVASNVSRSHINTHTHTPNRTENTHTTTIIITTIIIIIISILFNWMLCVCIFYFCCLILCCGCCGYLSLMIRFF